MYGLLLMLLALPLGVAALALGMYADLARVPRQGLRRVADGLIVVFFAVLALWIAQQPVPQALGGFGVLALAIVVTAALGAQRGRDTAARRRVTHPSLHHTRST